MSTAAPFAGMSARSAQSWLARGREEGEHLQRGEAAKKAEAIQISWGFLLIAGLYRTSSNLPGKSHGFMHFSISHNLIYTIDL